MFLGCGRPVWIARQMQDHLQCVISLCRQQGRGISRPGAARAASLFSGTTAERKDSRGDPDQPRPSVGRLMAWRGTLTSSVPQPFVTLCIPEHGHVQGKASANAPTGWNAVSSLLRYHTLQLLKYWSEEGLFNCQHRVGVCHSHQNGSPSIFRCFSSVDSLSKHQRVVVSRPSVRIFRSLTETSGNWQLRAGELLLGCVKTLQRRNFSLQITSFWGFHAWKIRPNPKPNDHRFRLEYPCKIKFMKPVQGKLKRHIIQH